MKKSISSILLVSFFAIIHIVSNGYAGETEPWPANFETEFTQSFAVGGVSFMYPKEFELSETTMGVFLETADLSGQISEGSAIYRNRDAAEELLVQKQGGKLLGEYKVNGHLVFAAESLQGEQVCRTYIVVPRGSDSDKTLYIQFRWQTPQRDDYVFLLDRLVSSMK